MTRVIYYTSPTGENFVKNFIASLSTSQKAKIIRILTYIEEYGLVTAIRHVKKLTGIPLWEIRILGQDNIRVLYATIEDDAIIILHGFMKKKQKTPEKELKITISRLQEWTKRTKRT